MPPPDPAMLVLQPTPCVEYETLLPSKYADNARSVLCTALQPFKGSLGANKFAMKHLFKYIIVKPTSCSFM